MEQEVQGLEAVKCTIFYEESEIATAEPMAKSADAAACTEEADVEQASSSKPDYEPSSSVCDVCPGEDQPCMHVLPAREEQNADRLNYSTKTSEISGFIDLDDEDELDDVTVEERTILNISPEEMTLVGQEHAQDEVVDLIHTRDSNQKAPASTYDAGMTRERTLVPSGTALSSHAL